ncbi:GldM family protein [Seonamhaeicola marinus]|uniref:Uncharacterized protein n=1 Tax=Seonamhaeicola marinus TaxID=1912246 RepID=A0A5D0JJZ1_9FLAO|nr:GldM family protein [Seonamhaeicola marinus]TYA94767.1 hypothetical protein FUA24_00840 [Seonamhaeicola marinus]
MEFNKVYNFLEDTILNYTISFYVFDHLEMKTYLLPIFLFFSLNILGQNIHAKPIIEFLRSPKVLYRGIYNNLKINVSKTDSIQLYDTENSLIPKSITGYYRINCTSNKLGRKTLIVKSFLNGLNIKSDSIIFKVENIDRPRLKIGNYSGKNLKMTVDELKNAKLEVFVYNLHQDYKIKVSGYKIKIADEKIRHVYRDSISTEIYSKLKDLQAGKELLIFDVQYHSPYFRCGKRTSPVYIEIMNER